MNTSHFWKNTCFAIIISQFILWETLFPKIRWGQWHGKISVREIHTKFWIIWGGFWFQKGEDLIKRRNSFFFFLRKVQDLSATSIILQKGHYKTYLPKEWTFHSFLASSLPLTAGGNVFQKTAAWKGKPVICLNLGVIIRTCGTVLLGGVEHEYESLLLIFWLSNIFYSNMNTINLKVWKFLQTMVGYTALRENSTKYLKRVKVPKVLHKHERKYPWGWPWKIRVIIDAMFICYFAYSDLGVGTFSEK